MPKGYASKPLDANSSSEVDGVDSLRWQEVCGTFADANIYQTLPYEFARSGRGNVSHLLLRRDSTVVAAVQARVLRMPYLKSGVAYIRWGPLWRRRDGTADIEVFRQAVRALRAEYVEHQRLCLRIVPQVSNGQTESFHSLLEEEGYVLRPLASPSRTILMDLRPSLEELHQGLHHKWRYHLGKARKQNLELVEGEEDELFQAFEQIYDEMVDRKKFVCFTDIRQFRRLQRGLAPGEKLRVFLCKVDGEVCSGGICSALGDTGIYLFGATSNRGMKTYGSYLVHWRMLAWVKSLGCGTYDLNGIDPVKNPGGYQFKSQLAGAHGHEVTFVGQYDAYPDAATKLLVAGGDLLRTKLRRGREALARWW